MKKIVVLLLLVVAVGGFGQTTDLQHMTRWQNVERRMHDYAGQYLRGYKDTTRNNSICAIDSRTGVLIHAGYIYEEKHYMVMVSSYATSDNPDYEFPFMEWLSLRTGAFHTFETLYGRPETEYSERGLTSMWYCSNWYYGAFVLQRIDGRDTIMLYFDDDSFF